NPSAGQSLQVTWDDTNSGNAAININWTDLITIHHAGYADLNYYVLAASGASGLAAGLSLAQQTSFTLPDGPAGAGDLLVTITTDIYNQVAEFRLGGAGELNNASSITVHSTLAVYADLQVVQLTAPTTAQPGQTITVYWTDVN